MFSIGGAENDTTTWNSLFSFRYLLSSPPTCFNFFSPKMSFQRKYVSNFPFCNIQPKHIFVVAYGDVKKIKIEI